LWFLKCSGFIFPISMHMQTFDIHGYIFLRFSQNLIQEKPWVLRIHNVLYSKVTPLYLYHMHIRPEHS
jgi:hypothetical protein